MFWSWIHEVISNLNRDRTLSSMLRLIWPAIELSRFKPPNLLNLISNVRLPSTTSGGSSGRLWIGSNSCTCSAGTPRIRRILSCSSSQTIKASWLPRRALLGGCSSAFMVIPLVKLLQLVSLSGVVQNFETYIYSAAQRHSSFMMLALSPSRWYIVSHQREVFPGLDSGPNCSEGHYFYTLEKRPSGDSLYTTYLPVDDVFQFCIFRFFFPNWSSISSVGFAFFGSGGL